MNANKPLHQMRLWKAALLTFAAMCCQDILGTCMVVYEAQLNWQIAGIFDVTGYIAGLVCSVLALDSILKDGWRNKRSIVLLVSVTLANYVGTALGVIFVAHLTHS